MQWGQLFKKHNILRRNGKVSGRINKTKVVIKLEVKLTQLIIIAAFNKCNVLKVWTKTEKMEPRYVKKNLFQWQFMLDSVLYYSRYIITGFRWIKSDKQQLHPPPPHKLVITVIIPSHQLFDASICSLPELLRDCKISAGCTSITWLHCRRVVLLPFCPQWWQSEEN